MCAACDLHEHRAPNPRLELNFFFLFRLLVMPEFVLSKLNWNNKWRCIDLGTICLVCFFFLLLFRSYLDCSILLRFRSWCEQKQCFLTALNHETFWRWKLKFPGFETCLCQPTGRFCCVCTCIMMMILVVRTKGTEKIHCQK